MMPPVPIIMRPLPDRINGFRSRPINGLRDYLEERDSPRNHRTPGLSATRQFKRPFDLGPVLANTFSVLDHGGRAQVSLPDGTSVTVADGAGMTWDTEDRWKSDAVTASTWVYLLVDQSTGAATINAAAALPSPPPGQALLLLYYLPWVVDLPSPTKADPAAVTSTIQEAGILDLRGGMGGESRVMPFRARVTGASTVQVTRGRWVRNGYGPLALAVDVGKTYKTFDISGTVNMLTATEAWLYVQLTSADNEPALVPAAISLAATSDDPAGVGNEDDWNRVRYLGKFTIEDEAITAWDPWHEGDIDDTQEIPDAESPHGAPESAYKRQTIAHRDEVVGEELHTRELELFDVATVASGDKAVLLYDQSARKNIWRPPDANKSSPTQLSIEAKTGGEAGDVLQDYDFDSPPAWSSYGTVAGSAVTLLARIATPLSAVKASKAYMPIAEMAGYLEVHWESDGGFAAAVSLSFLDLVDTPSSYTDQAGKVPRVNSGETALEFSTVETLLATVQSAHIANASVAHAVTDFAETNAALDALGGKINAILSALRTAGILAES